MLEDDPLAGPRRADSLTDCCCSNTDVATDLVEINVDSIVVENIVEGIGREQTTKKSTVTKGRLA